MNRGRSLRALALALLVAPAVAAGHQSSIVYLRLAPAGREVQVQTSIKSGDLFEALGKQPGQTVSPADLRASAAVIGDYVGRRVAVSSGGERCVPHPAGLAVLTKTDGFFAQVSLRYACPRLVEHLVVDYDLFFDLDPRHQGFATVVHAGGTAQHVFRRDDRHWEVAAASSAWANARAFLALGVEHIFTGYDHIMFLAGLLVIAAVVIRRRQPGDAPSVPAVTVTPRGLRRGLGYTLKIVTAFTLAHSLTLIAAALGWLQLPTRLTESGIAVSIAAIGLLNLLGVERGGGSRRWLVAFGFGLVHGFGFASILREIGLPSRGLLLSLLSFNLGVEVGQACIVALIFPVLHVLARSSVRGYHAAVVRVGSVVILAFGLFWLVERASGVPLLGGALG
jgi:hypothetical protein